MMHNHPELPIVSVTDRPPVELGSGYEAQVYMAYFVAAKTHPLAQQKRKAMETDARLTDLKNKFISRGLGSERFDLDKLVAWWLWRAHHADVDTADRDLNSFLDNDKIDCWAVLWVHGVKPSKIIQLTETIKIVPVEEMLDCGEKEEIFRSRWRHKTNIVPVPSAALVAEFITDKIHPEPLNPEGEIFDCFDSLTEVALLLNVLPGIYCVGGYETSYAPPHVPFGPLGGRGGQSMIREISPFQGPQITTECVTSLQQLLAGFDKLSKHWKARIARGVNRMGQAKGRIDYNDKALDLGIALEMVLLHSVNKQELPGQLHNHFRLRGAWLTGKSYDERKRNYDTLGNIYTQRSQVAHNGTISLPKKSDRSQIDALFDEHFSLAENIFYKLITDGPPSNWTALVLGGTTINETS